MLLCITPAPSRNELHSHPAREKYQTPIQHPEIVSRCQVPPGQGVQFSTRVPTGINLLQSLIPLPIYVPSDNSNFTVIAIGMPRREICYTQPVYSQTPIINSHLISYFVYSILYLGFKVKSTFAVRCIDIITQVATYSNT